ncbi:MAG: hypothetical protein ACREMZ_11195 [Gemmatimonadales bacterium]
MTEESKVPGYVPGEYERNPLDPRFAAVLPRHADESEADYTKRLADGGYVVVLEREQLRQGGYPKAKAQAMVKGAVLLVPLDDTERHFAAQQAANAPDASPLADPEARAKYIEAERLKAKPFHR